VSAFAVTAVVVAASVFATLPATATAQAFGGAVLIAGDYILVGEAAHEREPGTVWVFARDGDEWTRVAALRSDGSSTGNRFGKTLRRTQEPLALEKSEFAWNWSRSGEPDGLSRHDFVENRLSRLVRQALEQGHLSMGRAAEILGLTREEMRSQAREWAG